MSIAASAIASTLTAAAAARRAWEVVVVGAGPAGASAARALALHGTAVLLLDRASFPRGKVCGCCLGHAALDELQRAGLGALPRRLGARRLTRIDVAHRGRRVSLPLPRARAVSRDALDAALLRAALDAGAHLLAGVSARLDTPPAHDHERDCHDDGWQRVTVRGATTVSVRARVVLDATGLDGLDAMRTPARGASYIGLQAVLDTPPGSFRDGIIHMACGAAGYVGAVRLEDGRLDVAAALDPAAVRARGGPHHALAAVLADAGTMTPRGLERARVRGTRHLTRRPARVASHRLLAIGDAAGYVEPFTGEGIGWALATGRVAATLAAEAARHERWSRDVERAWTRAHHTLVGRRQRCCRVTARLLRHPRLTALALATAGATPTLAGRLVAAIQRPFPPVESVVSTA